MANAFTPITQGSRCSGHGVNSEEGIGAMQCLKPNVILCECRKTILQPEEHAVDVEGGNDASEAEHDRINTTSQEF